MSTTPDTDLLSLHIQQGALTGRRDGGVYRFSAIPFAQAPVGDLRFKPPVPAGSWQGTRDATRPGPIAPQLPSRLANVMGDIHNEQSEDCLHLTVWTPAADAKRRPVLVWLHGGAWQSGGGALDWYNGAALAEKGDLVVVTPNYRLAALGWLHVPGETANVGLLDQEAAIQWVVENIEAFGGDPENITLMGQSAGATSIACLMARQARYPRVIVQSASMGRGFWSSADAASLAGLVLEAAGAKDLDHARTLPYSTFLKAQQAPQVVQALKEKGAGRALFSPVVDGEVIASDAADILPEVATQADVLIGYTQDEMAAFPGFDTGPASHAVGDRIFGAPSRQWAEYAARAGRKAYLYRFDYAPTECFGACHCIELPFVFGTLCAFQDAPMLHADPASHMEGLVDTMQRQWIDFIRGGAPETSVFPHLTTFK